MLLIIPGRVDVTSMRLFWRSNATNGRGAIIGLGTEAGPVPDITSSDQLGASASRVFTSGYHSNVEPLTTR